MIFKISNIFRVMEFEKLLFGCMAAFVNVHFLVEVKTLDEGVSHSNPSRFHGMLFVVVKFSYLVVIEICHFIMHYQLNNYTLISLFNIYIHIHHHRILPTPRTKLLFPFIQFLCPFTPFLLPYTSFLCPPTQFWFPTTPFALPCIPFCDPITPL